MKINQKGFTLIEILVVIALVGIIASITADVFIQIIKASNKANITTEIKQNADAALSQIERLVRNAEEITYAGEHTYTDSSFTWTDKVSLLTSGTPWTCGNETSGTVMDVCAIIVKNPQNNGGGYTKIELHQEADKECDSTPFTTNDQVGTSAPYQCNGNIRMVTDNDYNNLLGKTPIGNVITNTEKRSGVSMARVATGCGTPQSLIKIQTVASTTNKPPLVTFTMQFTQALSASSRLDSRACVPFEKIISLRNY